MVRNAGAEEVHARIGSPPIVAPCYLGIDMASRDELIAAHKTIKGVEAVINADSLGYLSVDGLVKAIGIERDDLCKPVVLQVLILSKYLVRKCAARRQLKLHEF
ncbi:MAG: hypothetical protein R2741_00105 [Methanolobus sp.]